MATAFVFSGEGARGSYQAGIVKALDEKGIVADATFGTSSGALNATGYSYLGVETLTKVWKSIDRIEKVFSPNKLAMLWKKGAYSSAPLHRMVRDIVLQNVPSVPVTVTKVNILTGELVFDDNQKSPAPLFIDSVVSSASIPGLVEPMAGVWVDGGVRAMAPLKAAVKSGADKICVIVGQPLKMEVWEDIKGFFKIGPVDICQSAMAAMRSMNLAMHQALMNDLRLALRRNKMKGFREIEIQVFGPKELPFGGLDFKSTPKGVEMGYSHHTEFDLTDL